MRRTVTILLLLALVLGLAACGGIQETPGQQGEKQEDTVAETKQPSQTAKPGAETTSKPTAEPDPEPVSGASAVLARAVYPEMAQYPDPMGDLSQEDSDAYEKAWKAWRESLNRQRSQPEGYADGLEPYLRAVMQEFLTAPDRQNKVLAPMNVYMALAMLAELTDGQSRAQVLSLLGVSDLKALRTKFGALWNASYRDDGLVSCLLGSSLWLNEQVGFVQETMDRLAEEYYASSFQGKMGSAEFDKALQDWLNEQTGGLLENQVSGLHMDARTVLALATTIYFKAPWSSEFSKSATSPQVFHAPSGDRETDFLHKGSAGTYYWGEHFSAVCLGLENQGGMWFLLPDEGVTPEELLQDEEALKLLLDRDRYGWKNQKHLVIRMAIPAFDVDSDMDLSDGLMDLGVRDVFNSAVSDFTPMTTDEDEIFLSQARHAARVMIDEEGCTGAAYTVMMMAAGSAMPPEESVDFVADRPFLFLVTGADGLPLFTGVVNEP